MPFDPAPVQDETSLSPAARAYFATAMARSRAAAASTPHTLDVPYGGDPLQTLDIFTPADAPGDLPVLIFLHGGGWTHGLKEHCAFMAPAITALPAVFVSVSYRLSPAVRFPAHLEDTIAALAFVRRHIASYGGDPERLFIGGHSAGGHLATFAALREDLRTAAGLPQDVIKGVLPVSTTFNFEVGQLEGEGKIVLDRPGDAPSASLVNFIAAPVAPMHIVWGERDFDRCRTTVRRALDLFAERGWQVTTSEMPGRNHFEAHLDLLEPACGWLDAVRRMMRGT